LTFSLDLIANAVKLIFSQAIDFFLSSDPA
jgi:hypothetical protein